MSFNEKNISLLVNPLHPCALRVAEELVRLLKEKAVAHTVFTTSWPQNWVDVSEAWIVGGDGTLNFFINQYRQFDLPMAIFRGGTGNDFHWLLYGEISIAQQVEQVLAARP